MKTIALTQGKVAVVDDADYPALARFRWYAMRSGKKWRACRTIWIAGKNKSRVVSMHAQLMDFPSKEIDHRNRNPLDNRRENLRLATHQQQMANSDREPRGAGFRGVRKYWFKFNARITINRKSVHLGSFSTAEDAARAYDKAALVAFGDFAVLNFSKAKEAL